MTINAYLEAGIFFLDGIELSLGSNMSRICLIKLCIALGLQGGKTVVRDLVLVEVRGQLVLELFNKARILLVLRLKVCHLLSQSRQLFGNCCVVVLESSALGSLNKQVG